jgi:hypothetical protein
MGIGFFNRKKVKASGLLFAVRSKDIPEYLRMHNIAVGAVGILRRVDEDIYSFTGIKEDK